MISRSWRCISSSNGGGRREFSSAITPFYTPHEGECEISQKLLGRCRSAALACDYRQSFWHLARSVGNPLSDLTKTRWRCFKKQRNELIKEEGDDVSLD